MRTAACKRRQKLRWNRSVFRRSEPDDRCFRSAGGTDAVSITGKGGKSELRRAVRRVTPGQGDLKESGTENIPPELCRSAGEGGALRSTRANSLQVSGYANPLRLTGERESVPVSRRTDNAGKGEKVR